MLKNPKYRTWDSPQFVEPVVDYGPSLTDPSQDVPVSVLVERHVRAGSPAHGLTYGEDLSRVDFTVLHSQARAAQEAQQEEAAKKKELEVRDLEKARADRKSVLERVEKQLKAGSPELQQLAAELTRILPGFEGPKEELPK